MARYTAKSMIEAARTARDLLAFRYPGFVYGLESNPKVIPVFCFHSVEPRSFEAMLNFLESNNYHALDTSEYDAILRGRKRQPGKTVMLTFDDGWGSLWSVAFPLLRRFDTKIVVFIPPGRIETQDVQMPDLDYPAAARCCAEDVPNRDSSACPLLTWEEIAPMHDSGLVDFQSHSYSHSLVTSSARVIDFVNPELMRSYNLLELPCAAQERPGRPASRMGEPLYQTAPRLSDIRRLFTDQRIADQCAEFVGERGGERFFHLPHWRRQLHGVVAHCKEESRAWPRESPEEHAEAVRIEVVESKHRIEQILPGKQVRYICYPWHTAGSIATAQVREAGYAGAFWGKIDGRYYTPIHGDPFRIARVGADFFFRLPGKGRISLARILMHKAIRRAREGSPYLTH